MKTSKISALILSFLIATPFVIEASPYQDADACVASAGTGGGSLAQRHARCNTCCMDNAGTVYGTTSSQYTECLTACRKRYSSVVEEEHIQNFDEMGRMLED
jgi:hypothetical protein